MDVIPPIPQDTFLQFRNGFDNEARLVVAIREHLLTSEQKTLLFTMDLSIEDCLNGRYTANHEQDLSSIYKAWNRKLGFRNFGS